MYAPTISFVAVSVVRIVSLHDRMVVLRNHSQISHHIPASIAREFTNNIKQPTRSQEYRSTDPVLMPLIRHGRQTSERMHPKRVVIVKSVSSVGAIGYTRERGGWFRQVSST